MDQVNAVFLHLRRFQHAIVVDRREILAFYLHSFHSYRAGQLFDLRSPRKPVFFDDLPHLFRKDVVLLPFLHQHVQDRLFRFGVDDVDDDFFFLQKAVDAVDRLYEIVKLVIDTDEDRPMAIPLEVTART